MRCTGFILLGRFASFVSLMGPPSGQPLNSQPTKGCLAGERVQQYTSVVSARKVPAAWAAFCVYGYQGFAMVPCCISTSEEGKVRHGRSLGHEEEWLYFGRVGCSSHYVSRSVQATSCLSCSVFGVLVWQGFHRSVCFVLHVSAILRVVVTRRDEVLPPFNRRSGPISFSSSCLVCGTFITVNASRMLFESALTHGQFCGWLRLKRDLGYYLQSTSQPSPSVWQRVAQE